MLTTIKGRTKTQINRMVMETVSPVYLNEIFGSLQKKPNCLYGITPNSKTAKNMVTENNKTHKVIK